jgi:hypothetical protein
LLLGRWERGEGRKNSAFRWSQSSEFALGEKGEGRREKRLPVPAFELNLTPQS